MILGTVLQHVKRGGYIFPLAKNSKIPAIKGFNFNEKASRDEKTISQWVKNPTYNFGLITGKFKDDEALIAIDVDVAKGKNGKETFEKLKKDGRDFPETFTQFTPSGGMHLIYKTKKPVRQGVNILGPGLDIRSKGGYVVASGSQIDGKKYTDNGKEIVDAPLWLVTFFETEDKTPVFVNGNGIHHGDFDDLFAIERGKNYLKLEAPLAVEGAGGDHTTFVVCAKLKDFGVPEDIAFTLLCDFWNEECSPPWDPQTLQTKLKNAYTYGENKFGSDAPQKVFDEIKSTKEKNYLEQINDQYAIIYDEASHFILFETIDEAGKKKRKFFNEITFKRLFSPFTVEKTKRGMKTQAEVWLNWKGRRQYSGLCFAPEREPRNGYYNLWTGFSCTPTPYNDASKEAREGFDMFMRHVEQNIVQGDKILRDWVLGYFAHLIQKPYERPLTTLVLRGRKGTGKNVMVDRIGNLLGRGHYLVAHDGRYLTSNFNGHLDACLCLVLDEAFWSGDKSAEGKLKGLTTAPEILIERKGKEPYTVDNLVRLVVIGNEDWVVPASYDERRYAVFEVGEDFKQNTEYFSKMRDLIDNQGGNEVLLHYLKTFNLSKVDVNVAPKTAGLLEQQLSSLNPFFKFWHECLREGQIVGMDFDDGNWPQVVEKEVLRTAFKRVSDTWRVKSWIDSRQFSKDLLRCAPSIILTRPRVEGRQRYSYRLPSLDIARHDWDKFMGQTSEWPDLTCED